MSQKKFSAGVIKHLLSYTRPYAGYLIAAMACAFFSVVLSLMIPVFVGEGVDCLVSAGKVDYRGLARAILYIALSVAGAAVFQWLMSYCNNVITYRTVKDLRIQLFRKLSSVPLKYIDQRSHGDLISRVVNDIDQVSDGLLQGFTQLFTGIVTILGTLVFMLAANVWVALLVVVLTPLSLFVASFIAKNSFRHFRGQTAIQGELSGYVEEMVSNQKLVKAFCYEDRSEEKLEEINRRLYTEGQKAQFFSSLSNPCTRFVNAVVYAAVGIAGAAFAISGLMTVGTISMFLSYANQYTKPFNEVTGIITQLQTALASAQRVFAVLDEPSETPDAPEAMVKESCGGRVELRDVSFSYSPERPLIEHLNLLAVPGSRIAIVGPTGCGKTTLINLLMRFYDVNGGAILVDGDDIREMTRGSMRAQYGMVLQESWLFSGTVRDNIAYARPDASMEEVEAAAKAAHAHQFIKRLPEGYNTVIAEDGGNLSQGQKQLLCIARVMLADPPMLILDEATSNIDTRTEILVHRAFQEMMKGRTSFVVAHRLSTIRESDLILVMNQGHIVEQGTHDALLAKGGFYANLYNSQFARAED
ncbi:MAG TPA: ABC transporter ATP-binding protein [Candidatus Merdivicinus intestinavium]|nr:ABC transporter ATP-binding protein [Candidatus Merdivicinus intestinavium]